MDLLVVLLGHYFAEFVEEDVFGLVDAIVLVLDELGNGYSLGPLLGEVQQLASIFEVDFPGVQDAPGD